MKFLILGLLSILVLDLQVSFAAKKLVHEQSCELPEDCDEGLGFSCQNKVCKCAKGGETVYSATRKRCVGAGGRECFNQTCVDNAECQNYGYVHLCTCKDTFYQGMDGNCYTIAKYGETCREEDYSCGDTMTTAISCIEKRCRCLLGEENQYFLEKEKRCISYAGGHCLSQNQDSCTLNSNCDSIYETINGASFHVGHKCRCLSGYSYTRNRHCLGHFSSPCNITHTCNYDQFLGCMNGRCQCRNAMLEIWNEKLGQCTLLVDSPCKVGEGPLCTDHAECVFKPPAVNSTDTGTAKCKCSKPFTVTPLNTCLVDIGQKCESQLSCNYFNGLACVNGTCNCLDVNLKYEKETKVCVGLLGLPCGNVNIYSDSEETIETYVGCASNLTCSKVMSNGINISKRVCKAASTRN